MAKKKPVAAVPERGVHAASTSDPGARRSGLKPTLLKLKVRDESETQIG
jgi:hypothetical protein